MDKVKKKMKLFIENNSRGILLPQSAVIKEPPLKQLV
jgi:hypothetical protein